MVLDHFRYESRAVAASERLRKDDSPAHNVGTDHGRLSKRSVIVVEPAGHVQPNIISGFDASDVRQLSHLPLREGSNAHPLVSRSLQAALQRAESVGAHAAPRCEESRFSARDRESEEDPSGRLSGVLRLQRQSDRVLSGVQRVFQSADGVQRHAEVPRDVRRLGEADEHGVR